MQLKYKNNKCFRFFKKRIRKIMKKILDKANKRYKNRTSMFFLHNVTKYASEDYVEKYNI